MTHEIKAVVFDLDGTLIDSAPDIAAAVNRVLVGHGWAALETHYVERFIGDGPKTLLLRILEASLAGASNREIGLRLVYPWLAGTDALAWKATSERRRVQRLVAEARDLSASGYRDLLRS